MLVSLGFSILLIAALTSLALLVWDSSARTVRAHTSSSIVDQRKGGILSRTDRSVWADSTIQLPATPPVPVKTATLPVRTTTMPESATDGAAAPPWPMAAPVPAAPATVLLAPALSGLEPANRAMSQGPITFAWQTMVVPEVGQRLELVFWQEEQSPLQDGISVAVPAESQSLAINLHQLDIIFRDRFGPGEYQWGLLLVQVEPAYKRLAYLGGGHTFIFE